MDDVVNFILRHGEAFVFLYVLADQLGVPVPAVPALLAMGALAGVGKIACASGTRASARNSAAMQMSLGASRRRCDGRRRMQKGPRRM